ncbi:MAG TPA: hypothetical protein DIC52_24870 [Candidatus Latescibacteria bacterium]|nr:hypothetical protein [Candidatus Latescibacterota bacterium]
MGVFFDLGRPVIGGWMGGGWASHDDIRGIDIIWGGEFGQEGSILFGADVDTGQIVERHWIPGREFDCNVDPRSGTLWIHTYHGIYEYGHILQSWTPREGMRHHGFPALSEQRFYHGCLDAEGRIWIGTHPGAHLVSFDSKTDSWTDHGVQAPEPRPTHQQIWCNPQYVASNGEVVCNIQRDPSGRVAYDPSTGQTRVLTQGDERLHDDPDAPDRPATVTRAVSATFRQESCTYTVDGQVRTVAYEPTVATDICGLHRGPDGDIYGTTIISMHVFRYHPAKRQLQDLGRVGWGGGEVYDVIAYDGKVYMGSYGGGYFAAYDPALPWNPMAEHGGEHAEANPRNFGQLGKGMNRPFEYTVGPDGRIYIACRANYHVAGGGLGVFDPKTEEKIVHRDTEQSVQSVASDDTWVYGGTSIRGGRGCIETTTEARLFMFSPSDNRRVFECIPQWGAITIGNLACSPVTGLVYGSTDTGHLFAFCPERRRVLSRWEMNDAGTPLMGIPEAHGIIHLTCGRDGDIYGVTRRDVFKLDVTTGRILYLDKAPIPDLCQIVEGPEDGVFYIGARGHLLEYHVQETPHFR